MSWHFPRPAVHFSKKAKSLELKTKKRGGGGWGEAKENPTGKFSKRNIGDFETTEFC